MVNNSQLQERCAVAEKLREPCKFRYVKPVGNHTEDVAIDRQRKVAFSTTALSSDTTGSAANPDEYRQDLCRQKPQTVAADSICASLCILKQSCLKTRASMVNDSTQKVTVYGAKWLFKVIQLRSSATARLLL